MSSTLVRFKGTVHPCPYRQLASGGRRLASGANEYRKTGRIALKPTQRRPILHIPVQLDPTGRLQSRIGAVAAEYWATELYPSCPLRRRLRLLLVMMSRIRVRFDHRDCALRGRNLTADCIRAYMQQALLPVASLNLQEQPQARFGTVRTDR
jgi:hypothetical protein